MTQETERPYGASARISIRLDSDREALRVRGERPNGAKTSPIATSSA